MSSLSLDNTITQMLMNQHYSFTCTLLQHYDDTLAVGCRLHTYSLLVHQPIEAERVPGLQVVGLLSQNKDIQITGMHLFNYLA